jgi:hypothetical protein
MSLDGQSVIPNVPGVSGENTGGGNGIIGSGDLNGVLGQTSNPEASGVLGINTTSGYGVAGSSDSGTGVLGESLTGKGVLGRSKSSTAIAGESETGIAVQGHSQTRIGVYGQSGARPPSHAERTGGHGTEHYGVSGWSGSGAGVFGQSEGPYPGDFYQPSNSGVWGDNAGGGYGVAGTSKYDEKGGGIGVYGRSATGVNGEGSIFGVIGNGATNGVSGTSGSGGAGVVGTGGHYGVVGSSPEDNGTGVQGEAPDGYGVYGKSDNRYGVNGQNGEWSGLQPIYGCGVWGDSNYGYGVYGSSRTADAVHGESQQGYAGGFHGNVYVTGSLSKGGGGFKIDHPLDPANKYLNHSFVESADMKNMYDGIALLNTHGEAVVELPEWFEALNHNFRYQLTALGASAPNLYIAEKISHNRFKIAGGNADMEVCWQVTGSRLDAWAQAHAMAVDEEKPANERDYYLHPELYAQPAEKSIKWARNPETAHRLKKQQEHSDTMNVRHPEEPGSATPSS